MNGPLYIINSREQGDHVNFERQWASKCDLLHPKRIYLRLFPSGSDRPQRGPEPRQQVRDDAAAPRLRRRRRRHRPAAPRRRGRAKRGGPAGGYHLAATVALYMCPRFISRPSQFRPHVFGTPSAKKIRDLESDENVVLPLFQRNILALHFGILVPTCVLYYHNITHLASEYLVFDAPCPPR